jgi:hypothetical protein
MCFDKLSTNGIDVMPDHRLDSPDPERVRDMIGRARDYAAAVKPARKR